MKSTGSKNNSVVTILFIVFIIIVVFIIYKGFGGKTTGFIKTTESTPQTTPPMTDQTSPTPLPEETSPTEAPVKPMTLKSVTTKEGAGEAAQTGDRVAMNYTGKFWTNGTVFDSNVDPKFGHVTPFEFNLGGGEVIKGWDVGIVGMKPGEKRTLTIPSDMAYGHSGRPGAIPPDSVLVFDVELLQIKK